MNAQEAILEKSLHIKRLISVFTKESFVCFFSDFILNHPTRGNTSFSVKLKSKYRDSLYLIALRLSSKAKGHKELSYFSAENEAILEEVADVLNEILAIYLEQRFQPDYLKEGYLKNQKFIHETTFKSYFQNGKLNYHEQEINHVIRMFKPYEKKIAERLGIGLDEMLEICRRLQDLFHEKTNKALSFLRTKEFQDLAPQLANSFVTGEDFNSKVEQLPTAFFEFTDKPHTPLLFKKMEIENIEQEKVEKFLDLFAVNVEDEMDLLFYSQPNPLEEKPILRFPNGKYLHVYQKHIPTALYKLLYKTLGQTPRELDKLNSRRGKIVFENLVEDIFFNFLKKEKNVRIFRNYYINGSKNEKDLLIISKYHAFIIECKASRFREPLRDTEKAFCRIKEDFNGCIQSGYEQCFEVEEKIYTSKKIVIHDNRGNQISEIDTKFIVDTFKIVATLERFGPIQTDLGLLLKLNNQENSYPWVVCVDDLETFLLSLRLTQTNSLRNFINYLTYRELLHERILTQDELDVCALFLQNPAKFKKLAESDMHIVPDPALQNSFDELYFAKKLRFKMFQPEKI